MNSDLWSELAERAGLSLSTERIERLGRWLDLLFEANRRMNLTRIPDRESAELHHVADALTLLPFLKTGEIRVADVGSGGGVPGVPLAIVRPEIRMTLIESTRKKAVFLSETIAALGLVNVTVIASRAEEAAQSPESRESFDAAVCRAVGELVWLAEWCLPLVRIGGRTLAMKGPKVRDELAAAVRPIRRLGGGEPIVHSVQLPFASDHLIVEIPKIARTDRGLPRPPSHAKAPLT